MVPCELVRNNASIQWTEGLRCRRFDIRTQLSQFAARYSAYTRQLFTASQRHLGVRIAMQRDIRQTQSEWGAKLDYVRLYAVTLVDRRRTSKSVYVHISAAYDCRSHCL